MIDFTSCEDGFRDYGGSDAKRSIIYNGEHYMLKLPETAVPKNDLQTSHINNVTSEYIGSQIIGSLGLPVQETILGLYEDAPAVACKDFATGEWRLQEFSWMMRSFYTPDRVGKIPTYEQIYEVMRGHANLRGIAEQAIARYWETFVADALIGNFDRHKGNFGYLVNERDREVRLAPVYDCGSCLYPGASVDAMKRILSSEQEIRKRLYEIPKAALNMNKDIRKVSKLPYYEGLASGFDENLNKAFRQIYRRIDMQAIQGIFDSTPFLGEERRLFISEMLVRRKEGILDKAYEKCFGREEARDAGMADLEERAEDLLRERVITRHERGDGVLRVYPARSGKLALCFGADGSRWFDRDGIRYGIHELAQGNGYVRGFQAMAEAVLAYMDGGAMPEPPAGRGGKGARDDGMADRQDI